MKKEISQSFNCSHSFMIPYSSCLGSLTDSLKRKLATNINSLGSRTHALELTRITLMITGLFYLSIMICHHVKKRYKGLFKLSFLSCSRTNGEVAFYDGWLSWDIFLNLFDCRFVFAPSFFLFNKYVTKERLALSHIQLNLALRTPA